MTRWSGGGAVACGVALLVFCSAATGSDLTLQTVFDGDLDGQLKAAYALAEAKAREWKPDARLNAVRLNLKDGGAVSWRFHWLSDADRAYLYSFSGAGSFTATGADPDARSKPTLDLTKVVGWSQVGRVLQRNGVDLRGITPKDVETLQLGHEPQRKPQAYYYYLFLRSGAQRYIVAETGELQQ